VSKASTKGMLARKTVSTPIFVMGKNKLKIRENVGGREKAKSLKRKISAFMIVATKKRCSAFSPSKSVMMPRITRLRMNCPNIESTLPKV